jgi:hypothetical protein
MDTKAKPDLQKPREFDLKRAQAIVNKLIRENKEWIKEMAHR